MKKKVHISQVIIVVFIVMGFITVQFVQAGTLEPGSDGDPLVTKSYVDAQINKIIQGNTYTNNPVASIDSQEVAELKAEVAELTNVILDLQNKVTSQTQSEQGFLPLNLKQGKKLITGNGAEVIVRSGTVKSIKGINGNLCDVTSGKDLDDGASILLNHHLISSRDDGRGVFAVDSSVWLLVKGDYQIK